VAGRIGILLGGRGQGRAGRSGWRAGARDGRRTAQLEHGTAVVGEENLVLLLGDIDAVRQEEVRAEQHVLAVEAQGGDAQTRVLDLLAADIEAVKWRDPAFEDAAADST